MAPFVMIRCAGKCILDTFYFVYGSNSMSYMIFQGLLTCSYILHAGRISENETHLCETVRLLCTQLHLEVASAV